MKNRTRASLLIPLTGRILLGLWQWRSPAQRTPDVVVVPGLQSLSSLGHFGLELLVGQRNRIAKVAEHVGDRAPAGTGPVSRVHWIPVGGCGVQEADEVNDG